MNAAQRLAWFNLLVSTSSALLFLALMPVLGEHALGALGLLGLLGCGPFIARHRGRACMDERDQGIQRRAVLIAMAVVWGAAVAAVAAGLLLVELSPPHGTVAVLSVASGVFLAFTLMVLVESLSTLVQYGRGAADAE